MISSSDIRSKFTIVGRVLQTASPFSDEMMLQAFLQGLSLIGLLLQQSPNEILAGGGYMRGILDIPVKSLFPSTSVPLFYGFFVGGITHQHFIGKDA